MKLWPFILAPIAGIGVYILLADVFKPWPAWVDWPDGRSSETDFWHRGAFLGYKADRIRRVLTWRKAERVLGSLLDDKQHIYFASISIPDSDMDHQLAEWRADAFFRRHSTKIMDVRPSYWPDWFPPPSKDNYFGSIVNDGGFISIYKVPGESKIYLWFE
jgi:hypothetical protein